MTLNTIRNLVADEMTRADDLITKSLPSDVELVNKIGYYIVNSGGKRLRPMITLLCGKLLGNFSTKHHTLAAVIEFIHTATLLHDDVVDASELRRGRETANHIWGNESTVLVGDYVYSRAFELMVSLDNLTIMAVMSKTTTGIAEGELLQLTHCHDPSTTEAQYLAIIERKTAILFAAACEAAALLSQCDKQTCDAIANFGLHFGIAYQLVDDALDYAASAEEMGKNCGDDLAEGKPTLPLLYAMQNGNETQQAFLQRAMLEGNVDDFNKIKQTIDDTHALDYTFEVAQQHANRAVEYLAKLPDSEFKDGLIALTEFILHRRQ